MKKFLILFVAAFALLTCTTSCEDNAFSFEYSFTVDGHANGDVLLMFPGGNLDMKGSSELEFNYSSAPVDVVSRKSMPSYTLQELRESDKQNYREVASLVENDLEARFEATSMDGTYYLHVVGIVRERLTGLEVKIDKVLSNEDPEKEEK